MRTIKAITMDTNVSCSSDNDTDDDRDNGDQQSRRLRARVNPRRPRVVVSDEEDEESDGVEDESDGVEDESYEEDDDGNDVEDSGDESDDPSSDSHDEYEDFYHNAHGGGRKWATWCENHHDTLIRARVLGPAGRMLHVLKRMERLLRRKISTKRPTRSDSAGSPPTPASISTDKLEDLSLKDLRALVKEAGLSSDDCIDKPLLLGRAAEALERLLIPGAALGPVSKMLVDADDDEETPDMDLPDQNERDLEFACDQLHSLRTNTLRGMVPLQWKPGVLDIIKSCSSMRAAPRTSMPVAPCALCGLRESACRHVIDATGPTIDGDRAIAGCTSAVREYINFIDRYSAVMDMNMDTGFTITDRGSIRCGKTCLRAVLVMHLLTTMMNNWLYDSHIQLTELAERGISLSPSVYYCATTKAATRMANEMDSLEDQVRNPTPHNDINLPVLEGNDDFWAVVDAQRRGTPQQALCEAFTDAVTDATLTPESPNPSERGADKRPSKRPKKRLRKRPGEGRDKSGRAEAVPDLESTNTPVSPMVESETSSLTASLETVSSANAQPEEISPLVQDTVSSANAQPEEISHPSQDTVPSDNAQPEEISPSVQQSCIECVPSKEHCADRRMCPSERRQRAASSLRAVSLQLAACVDPEPGSSRPHWKETRGELYISLLNLLNEELTGSSPTLSSVAGGREATVVRLQELTASIREELKILEDATDVLSHSA